MNTQPAIQFLQRKQVDDEKWNACLDRSANGLMYAYTWYLDTMAVNWNALVAGDYEFIMPLPWKEKFGIHYIYQPAFTAALGVFGDHAGETLINAFLSAIPSSYRLIEMPLNTSNSIAQPVMPYYLRTNYVLDLQSSYEEIRKGYRENHHRNIQRAIKTGSTFTTEVSVDEVIELNRLSLSEKEMVKEEDYHRFVELLKRMQQKGQTLLYGVKDAKQQLVSAAVFFLFRNRAYYIMGGNHPDGRTMGASHLLMDTFIRNHAGQPIILDFEGSDIRSLAFFYSGFGAAAEIYPALKINRLPFYLKWMKR